MRSLTQPLGEPLDDPPPDPPTPGKAGLSWRRCINNVRHTISEQVKNGAREVYLAHPPDAGEARATSRGSTWS